MAYTDSVDEHQALMDRAVVFPTQEEMQRGMPSSRLLINCHHAATVFKTLCHFAQSLLCKQEGMLRKAGGGGLSKRWNIISQE
jgi:hypothetical protein